MIATLGPCQRIVIKHNFHRSQRPDQTAPSAIETRTSDIYATCFTHARIRTSAGTPASGYLTRKANAMR